MFDASNVKNAKVCILWKKKFKNYKWDDPTDLNLKKLSLNVNHFTDSIFFLKFYISPESVLYMLLVPVPVL